MPLRIRYISHKSPQKHWTKKDSPSKLWKEYYRPPWLLILHITEVILLFILYNNIFLPSIKALFLTRQCYIKKICPDQDIYEPYSDLDDINKFLSDYPDNKDSLMTDSFKHLKYVDESKPHSLIIKWINGTVTESEELSIELKMLIHVMNFTLTTSFYSVSPKSSIPGCSKWVVSTHYFKNDGSYAYTSANEILNSPCPESIMEEMLPNLPKNKIRQAIFLKNISINVLILSVFSFLILVTNLIRRIKRHNKWHEEDSVYKAMEVSSQFHLSIGYWHLLHLLSEMLLLSCSIYMIIESNKMTQYPSNTMLTLYAFAVLFTYFIICRWFINMPMLYQLINIVRVSFFYLINIIIGLSPLAAGVMFLGSFIFGYVSNITKSYFRYFQMFIGSCFGDDLFYMFSYYTDGTDTFNTLAFFYVTILAILTGYVCFPAFTASISYLHKTKVVPEEERLSIEMAENEEKGGGE